MEEDKKNEEKNNEYLKTEEEYSNINTTPKKDDAKYHHHHHSHSNKKSSHKKKKKSEEKDLYEEFLNSDNFMKLTEMAEQKKQQQEKEQKEKEKNDTAIKSQSTKKVRMSVMAMPKRINKFGEEVFSIDKSILNRKKRMSQSFLPSYRPLTLDEKLTIHKQMEDDGNKRFKKYAAIFDSIKDQISAIDYDIKINNQRKQNLFLNTYTYSPDIRKKEESFFKRHSQLNKYDDDEFNLMKKTSKSYLKTRKKNKIFTKYTFNKETNNQNNGFVYIDGEKSGIYNFSESEDFSDSSDSKNKNLEIENNANEEINNTTTKKKNNYKFSISQQNLNYVDINKPSSFKIEKNNLSVKNKKDEDYEEYRKYIKDKLEDIYKKEKSNEFDQNENDAEKIPFNLNTFNNIDDVTDNKKKHRKNSKNPHKNSSTSNDRHHNKNSHSKSKSKEHHHRHHSKKKENKYKKTTEDSNSSSNMNNNNNIKLKKILKSSFASGGDSSEYSENKNKYKNIYYNKQQENKENKDNNIQKNKFLSGKGLFVNKNKLSQYYDINEKDKELQKSNNSANKKRKKINWFDDKININEDDLENILDNEGNVIGKIKKGVLNEGYENVYDENGNYIGKRLKANNKEIENDNKLKSKNKITNNQNEDEYDYIIIKKNLIKKIKNKIIYNYVYL